MMSTAIQVELPQREEVDCLYEKAVLFLNNCHLNINNPEIVFPDAFLLCRLCAQSSLVAFMHICISVNNRFITWGMYVSD